MTVSHTLRRWSILCAVLLLAACTSTTTRRADGIAERDTPVRGSRVLVMPPEVQLSELKASGLEEPRADWTEAASRGIAAALQTLLAERTVQRVQFTPPADPDQAERFRQLRLLYDVVGSAVMWHGLMPVGQLPHKKDRFDWTLGAGVRELGDTYAADYALYTYVQDSYASGGRKGLVPLGLLLGVNVSLGTRVGYCSLVDLKDGRIVWTGLLVSSTGDLRNPEGALAAMRQMLEDAPW